MTIEIDIPNLESNFITQVEAHVSTANVSYLDAIIHFSEQNKIELEYLAKIISKNTILKAKLQLEAENLHFMDKSVRIAI